MKMIQSKSKKFFSIMAALVVALFSVIAIGCGGGGGGGGVVVEAPGAPVNFAIADSMGQGMVTLTLSWDAPITGGEPTSYEIYRSDTNESVFQPANHYISLPATTYEFIENAGMEENIPNYWVVAAKNAGGETPSIVAEYTPPGGGEVEGFGNNFAAAMIFADGIGIGGDVITQTWTKLVSGIDFATGLRPLSLDALPIGTTELPYFDPTTTYEKDGVTYYKQQTASTWQGQWISTTVPDTQVVTAKWGDNLVSQTSLTTNSTVRIEMVLTKTVESNMTAYNMESLYGSTRYEIYGTDGNETNTTTAFVFAANAHLTIQKLEDNGTLTTLEDQPLFSLVPDGPGKFGAEINVAGNLTYGYVWDLKQGSYTAGTYRIIFSLDDISQKLTPNNTSIGLCPNGTLVSDKLCYIEINISE